MAISLAGGRCAYVQAQAKGVSACLLEHVFNPRLRPAAEGKGQHEDLGKHEMGIHELAVIKEVVNYEFGLGQCVDHVTGGMISTVADRSKTAMGRELYETVEAWTGERRLMLGSVLVPLSTGPQCGDCPIRGAGMCRGLM